MCGRQTQHYNSQERLCDCQDVEVFKSSGEDIRDYYVSMFPSPTCTVLDKLPPVFQPRSGQAPLDFWAIDVNSDERDVNPEDFFPSSILPYKLSTIETTFNERCGNPTVSELDPDLLFEGAGNEGLGKIRILDMSKYRWSFTLKDSRSFAIANLALDHSIKHLALWTAGNAALSLARMANHINAGYGFRSRITVHAIVARGTSPIITNTLRCWGAMVHEVPHTGILRRSTIRSMVKENALRTLGVRIDDSEYWDVTDGWDGVGTLMYRLLIAQVVKTYAPHYVIVPCGTGNLFVGAFLGIRDCELQGAKGGGIDPGDCTLVGVAPYGDNSLRSSTQHRIHPVFTAPSDLDTFDWPVMPKLAGFHTALAPCIDWLLRQRNVRIVQVNLAQQIAIGRKLHGQGSQLRIACEPSALGQFSALLRLSDIVAENPSRRAAGTVANPNVLVVNCGCGILDDSDHSLISALSPSFASH